MSWSLNCVGDVEFVKAKVNEQAYMPDNYKSGLLSQLDLTLPDGFAIFLETNGHFWEGQGQATTVIKTVVSPPKTVQGAS